MARLAFNKKERAKLAGDLAPMVARALKQKVAFLPHPILGTLDADCEQTYRLEGFDTLSGEVAHFDLSITHRGLDVHTEFKDIPRAMANGARGINEFSGKWNHYLWPEHGGYDDKLAYIATTLRTVLAKFKPA